MKLKQETYKNIQDKKQVRDLYGSYAQNYTRHYFSPTSLFGLEKQQRLKNICQSLKDLQPASVLDLGCGPGYAAAQIADDLNNAKVVGLDFSPEMIEVARRDYSKRATFIQGDAENLPFENTHFSAIFALGLMDKFEDPLRVFSECYRVLSPGGHLYFTYPNKSSFLRLFHWSVNSFLRETTGAPDSYIFPIDEMRNRLNRIGFIVLDITFITYGNSFVLFPWSAYQNKLLEKMFGGNFLGKKMSFTSFWKLRKAGGASEIK